MLAFLNFKLNQIFITMNHKSLFFAIISAVLLTTACEKNKGGEEIPEPVPVMDIDVQVNVLTDFTAGVTLIPESADNEYFACILPKEEYYTDSAAAEARILEMSASPEYSEFRFTGNADVIFTDLEEDSDYIICTAVYGESTRVSSTAEISTERTMERLEVTNTADIVDWGQEYGRTNASFTLRAGDAQLNTGEYWDYFSNGTIAEIYAVRKLESLENVPDSPVEFCGIYKTEAGDDVPGAIYSTNSYSSLIEYTENGENTEYDITSCAMQISASGEDFVITAALTLTDGRSFSCYYKGQLNLVQSSAYYGIYNYRPSLQNDMTGLDYPLMKYAYYCGEVDGMSKYSLSCVNDPDPGSSFGGYNKHCLKMEFYVPSQQDPYAGIPEGEYPISIEPAANTAIAGDYKWYDAINIDYLGSYYYLLDGETFEQTMGFMRSGTITVVHDGEGYRFSVDAETWDGYKITGTSTQESLVITDEPEW